MVRVLTRRELAHYEGRYIARTIEENGAVQTTTYELRADKGQLQVLKNSSTVLRLAFYRKDYVLALDAGGRPLALRADFVRGADGGIAWWRFGGRLYRQRL
ncbi:MAG: hypothetical protein WBP81_04415 [Solirubrobacteraceae bacterium]